MRKHLLFILLYLFISICAKAEKWAWIDFTFEQLEQENDIEFIDEENIVYYVSLKERENISSRESKFVYSRFFQDMGCYDIKFTESENRLNFTYGYNSNSEPIKSYRLYVNEDFGYAVMKENESFNIYRIYNYAKMMYEWAKEYYTVPSYNTYLNDIIDERNIEKLYDNLSKYYSLPNYENFKRLIETSHK